VYVVGNLGLGDLVVGDVEVVDVDVELAVEAIDLGLHALEFGRGLGDDPRPALVADRRVDDVLRTAPPVVSRLTCPPGEREIEVRHQGVADDLVEGFGPQRCERVDLGLIDAHRAAPPVGATLGFLQRR